MRNAQENELRRLLATRYTAALESAETEGLIDALRQSPQLSGIFLPDVFTDYVSAPLRVMLIGKETKGWLKGDKRCGNLQAGDLQAYVQHSMQEWRRIADIPAGKSKFGQFRQKLDLMLSRQADHPVRHHWANLFCIDHAQRSPVGSDHFTQIQSLSQRLLKIQLDVLCPDVLLFTTGVGSTRYDKHIKEMLTVTDSSFGTDQHIQGQLWTFRADGVAAYRTAHPRWGLGQTGREAALARILATEMEPT